MESLNQPKKLMLAAAAGTVAALTLAVIETATGISSSRIDAYLFFMVGFGIAITLLNNKRSRSADPQAREAALALRPAPGCGLVIVYRSGLWGAATGIDIGLDGRWLAQLKSPRFFAFDLAPGPHALQAMLASVPGSEVQRKALSFDLAAGQAAVFRLVFKFTGVALVPEDDPRPVVAKLKRTKMIAAEIAPAPAP